MTDLHKAAQQVLDWLYDNDVVHPTKVSEDLRAALAQQADKPQRPKCLEFALDFLGTPENGELLAYIEQLEARAALAQQAEPKGGGRLPPPLQAEPVQEPVACEPQYANDDGWCDWVCPKPRGYLMQCCDCELIHEVESRVAKYQPQPSEEFEVVDDPDLQLQWRMKRRDDISPQRKPLLLTDLQEALVLTNLIDRDAIDDSEEYDEGSTLAQIDELYRIIKERI